MPQTFNNESQKWHKNSRNRNKFSGSGSKEKTNKTTLSNMTQESFKCLARALIK